MSRIGKQPIDILEGVKVEVKDHSVLVSGPNGQLEQRIDSNVKVAIKENQVMISVNEPGNKKQAALWGLTRSLIANMVEGAVKSFEKKLEINGVGYRAAISGDKLVLNIGYSHPVEYKIPEKIDIKVDKNLVTISGASKQLVGQVAAEIRSVRKPEPYKGKGIKYIDEVIRRKVGKAAGKDSE